MSMTNDDALSASTGTTPGDPSTSPADNGPTNTDVSSLPATTAQPAAAAPAAQPAAPAAAPSGQPSMFRGILMGALAGIAASRGAKTFGEGLTQGAAGGIAQQQQQVQNKIEAQKTESQVGLEHAQAAMMAMNTAKTMHDIHLMPDTKQEEYMNEAIDHGDALLKSGAIVPMGAGVSLSDARQQYVAMYQQHPELSYSIQPVRGADGGVAYQVVQYPKAPISQPVTFKGLGPDGKDITFPAGTPADKIGQYYTTALTKNIDADTRKLVEGAKDKRIIEQQGMKDQTAIDVANIRAANQRLQQLSKSQPMQVGLLNGSPVAGSADELRAAGVQKFTKLADTEGQKTIVARQLLAPKSSTNPYGGLFQQVEDDLKALHDKGMDPTIGSARLNEFMTGKVGDGPEWAPLRTDVKLLSTALMQAHVGARGSKDMLEHFAGITAYDKMNVATLQAALDAEKKYVQEKAMMVPQAPSKPQTSSAPKSTGGFFANVPGAVVRGQ